MKRRIYCQFIYGAIISQLVIDSSFITFFNVTPQTDPDRSIWRGTSGSDNQSSDLQQGKYSFGPKIRKKDLLPFSQPPRNWTLGEMIKNKTLEVIGS